MSGGFGGFCLVVVFFFFFLFNTLLPFRIVGSHHTFSC